MGHVLFLTTCSCQSKVRIISIYDGDSLFLSFQAKHVGKSRTEEVAQEAILAPLPAAPFGA